MARTMDDFEVIVKTKEVYEKHRCFEKGVRGAGRTPIGQIICCKDCGRHHYCYETWMDANRIWKPVRWYHYKKRMAIVGKQ